MYTIAEAARRAGVTVPVLRAWERRYGIVDPERTASGYRLYDDAAIARVRALRQLVEAGWTPSAASARIRAEGLPPDLQANQVTAAPPSAGPPDPDPLIATFVDAAARLDQAALGDVLDELFARGSFERVTADLLMPALDALGDAWASGRVSVAGEHAASHAVLRRLSAAFEAAGGTGRSDAAPVLVGLPPGAHHELAALAFAVIARRAGLPVLYLGPDLPVEDWVRAAGDRRGPDRARAAVIGVATPADRPAAERVADALLAATPDLVVAFGGRSAEDRPNVLRLPDDLSDAASALSRRLGLRPRSARRGRPG